MTMMISKFHKIIQSKIVWTAFAILISVAFVGVYTGSKTNRQQVTDQQAGAVAGKLFGEEVTRQEFGRAYRNVFVMYSMRFGRTINVTEEVDEIINRSAWQRIATLKKAAQLGLTVTPKQTVDMIRNQSIFQNQNTGQFDQNAYNAFVTGFLPRAGMDPKSFEVMFSENVLIEKAANLAAQGALVTEQEIVDLFHLYTDKLTVEYAALPHSLADTPDVNEEDAKNYYNANQEQFRMPEKAIVHYVQYPVTDYTNNVTIPEGMATSFYESNKQRYVKPAAPGEAAGAEPEYQPFEEVEASINKIIISELARRDAIAEADALVAQLSDESTTFEQAAAKVGRTIVDNTPAFGATDRVKGVDPTAPFARSAFTLEKDKTHYYSDPVAGRDTVYVISLVKKLDAFLPDVEVVMAEAMESAKIAASETAYVEKAEGLHEEIKAALAAGTSFEEALSKYNLTTTKTAAFDATTPLENEFGREIQGATISLDSGELADLISTPGDFLVAYVQEKVAGDEAATLPAMRDELTNGIRNEKSARLAAAWQEALLKEAGFEDLRAAESES